jgi:hypothetical protein
MVLGLAGCAAVTGLQSIEESPCPFGCDGAAGDDGAADSTVSAQESGGADTNSSADANAAGDARNMDGTAHPSDSGRTDATSEADSGDRDGSPSISTDAEAGTYDAGHDGAAADSGTNGDSGCGPLDTVTNCGACGVECPAPNDATGVSSAMCAGTTCQYTCNAGYLDCNASVPPDSDGCECAWSGAITPTCCTEDACPSAHITGFATQPSGASETFYDCETAVSEKLAMDACTAYSGSASYCVAIGCGSPSPKIVVCNTKAPISQDSVCWAYAGTAAGWVYDAGAYPIPFTCPSGGGAGEVQFH